MGGSWRPTSTTRPSATSSSTRAGRGSREQGAVPSGEGRGNAAAGVRVRSARSAPQAAPAVDRAATGARAADQAARRAVAPGTCGRGAQRRRRRRRGPTRGRETDARRAGGGRGAAGERARGDPEGTGGPRGREVLHGKLASRGAAADRPVVSRETTAQGSDRDDQVRKRRPVAQVVRPASRSGAAESARMVPRAGSPPEDRKST